MPADKMTDKFDLFMEGGKDVSFDEGVWETGIERIKKLGDPTLMFGFEKRIIADMTSRVLHGPNPGKELDRVEDIVLNYEVFPDRKIRPFIDASRERVQGAAQTLRAYVGSHDLSEPLDELIEKAESTKEKKKRLHLAGVIGARILKGAPGDVTYSLPEGDLRQWLRGAKTVRNISVLLSRT